jgi:hypothetical protein
VAGTERGAGGGDGDAAQELELGRAAKRAQGTRAAFSARLTGISRQKGHKNANLAHLKKNEALRFYATMAAISSNGQLCQGLFCTTIPYLYRISYITYHVSRATHHVGRAWARYIGYMCYIMSVYGNTDSYRLQATY